MDVEEASWTLYESFLLVEKIRSCDFCGSFFCAFWHLRSSVDFADLRGFFFGFL
jgi:hypothetical protein